MSPGSTRSFGNLPFTSAVTANHFPTIEQDLQLRNWQLPEWSILPQWEDDDSPLGRSYTDFHRLAKQLPKAQDDQIDLVETTLLFRKRKPEDLYNADNWSSELQAALAGVFPKIVGIAGTYYLALLMRWLLDPTPATYAAIPTVLKPTMRQRMTSHPASIDVTPFPTLRNALLENMKDGLHFVAQAGMALDWPHTVNEALLCVQSEEEDDVRIFVSPQYAEYLQDPKHWILGRKILETFPVLADSEITISDEDVVSPVDRWL